jgi:hypothetical protein
MFFLVYTQIYHYIMALAGKQHNIIHSSNHFVIPAVQLSFLLRWGAVYFPFAFVVSLLLPRLAHQPDLFPSHHQPSIILHSTDSTHAGRIQTLICSVLRLLDSVRCVSQSLKSINCFTFILFRALAAPL